MAARKRIYCFGETIYICGNHVLRGKSGTILTSGRLFGSYKVEVEGRCWEIRGRNLMQTPMKTCKGQI